MEFWLENRGQSQLYPRFGTLPGRNCAHSYHERHQANYNTLYYGEQQGQGKDSSDWMVPGSRTGGALPEYTNWTEPQLAGFSSPNLPFVLHRHDQCHQDLEGGSHGAVRDYDRGFLRDGWPKRWDQTHPSRYNREVSAKRNDTSYRELEAWAARYSHSLPRRRRLEAELREGVQGPSQSSRAPERGKLETSPGVQLNRNSRVLWLWDKAEPPPSDLNQKIEYQSRVFGKPPGYIGPPPYNRPHQSPPVMHCDVGWQLVGKKEADWSQPTPRKQDVPVDSQTKRKVEKDESKTYSELEEQQSSKHRRAALQAPSPFDVHKPEDILTQEPQSVQNSSVEKKEICKVIEGRKFRLKKKTGGMTIFCLVSRIASPSEATSLPVCTPQTSVQSSETEELSTGRQDDNLLNKLADDVDFRPSTPKEQSEKKTPSCREKVVLKDDLPNNSVFLEKSGFERSGPQSVEPTLTKYPLWREPYSSTKAETGSSKTNCWKNRRGSISNHEGGDLSSHSTDDKKKKSDTQNAEDMSGLLVIDSSCVVVKAEMIASPKKEQVHYLGSTTNEQSRPSASDSQLYQDGTTDLHNEALERKEDPEDELDPTFVEEQEHKESVVSLPGLQLPSLSEKDTLEERAERILGLPLCDDEQQNAEEEPQTDLSKEEQNDEAEPPPSEQTLDETGNQDEALLVDKDIDNIREQLTTEDGKDFTESPKPAINITEENNTESQLEMDNTSNQTDMKTDRMSESESKDHPIDRRNSFSLSQNLSNSITQEGPDLDMSLPPDASPFPVQPLPLSPESPEFPEDDHLPSPPPLEVLFPAADVECGPMPKDDEGEMLHSAEKVVSNESLVTEMNELLQHQQNESHQCDDTPCVTENLQTDEGDSSRAETKHEDLNILAQQLSSPIDESVTCAKEALNLLVANRNPLDPTVQTGDENEGNPRTHETEGYHILHCLQHHDLDEDVLCKKERDATLEPCHGLIGSLSEQTGSNDKDLNTQTQLNTDTLQNSESQGDRSDYEFSSSRRKVSSTPQEPEGDSVDLLQTESTGSPLGVDIAAAADIVENASDPICLDSCEESIQWTMIISQEEDISPQFSPSSEHKKGHQYPKSLLDVVNRIRKHTAPDSESEEEEVSEQWDQSCLDVATDTKSEENFSDELQGVLKDSTETRQVDQDDGQSQEPAEEITLSCSDHVSEDTVVVIAGEELKPSVEVDEKEEESDSAEWELIRSSKKSEENDNLNICGFSVEEDQEAIDLLN